jgi:hypothetical protein
MYVMLIARAHLAHHLESVCARFPGFRATATFPPARLPNRPQPGARSRLRTRALTSAHPRALAPARLRGLAHVRMCTPDPRARTPSRLRARAHVRLLLRAFVPVHPRALPSVSPCSARQSPSCPRPARPRASARLARPHVRALSCAYTRGALCARAPACCCRSISPTARTFTHRASH